MVILSENPYNIEKEKISEIKVEKLILNGEDYISCRENPIKRICRGIMSDSNN